MKHATNWRHLTGFGRRLAGDEGGATLIYVSIALTVFMGFAALVIDASRVFTLDTETQSAADAFALAGAAELDGNVGAIDRAKDAIATLVQNSETFGEGAGDIAADAIQVRFLNGLPDSDADPITDDFWVDEEAEGADAEARFVEVTIAGDDRHEVGNLFAMAIGGGDTSAAGAVAVAGFTQGVCKFTPLFMCNPYEGDADTGLEFKAKIASTEERRRLIELKRHPGAEQGGGQAAMYQPGNFGFLETGAEGVKFRQSLAKISPDACFSQNGVTTKTGNNFSAHVPLNTRFDMYGGPFNKNNADYAPAKNVTKGYLPEQKIGGNGNVQTDYCKASDDLTDLLARAFPVDSSYDANRVGTGDWNNNFDEYWSVNHPDWPTPPYGWSSNNLPTRYDVYQWEIAQGEIPDNSGSTPMGENGDTSISSKRCSQRAPVTDPDRRILYAAIINCKANPFNGHTVGLPVVTFVKMFMTQPMTKDTGKDPEGQDSDSTLYVEMIDTVEPGALDEVVHDIVQLYR